MIPALKFILSINNLNLLLGKTKQADNSFTEKLVTQIIRNVQIFINNIHIRYEDTISKPGSPMAVGVTLHSLSVKSIDSWGDPTPIDPINLIFKVKS